MLKLKIDSTKKRYILPTNINEITFGKGIEISKLLNKKYKNNNDKRNIISLLIECNYLSLLSIDDKWIEIIYDKLNYLNNNLSSHLIVTSASFKLNKQKYTLKNIEDFTVLEFIDFCNLFNTDRINENYHQILSFIIRKCEYKSTIAEKITTYLYNFKIKYNKKYKMFICKCKNIEIYDGLNYNLENNDIYESLPFIIGMELISKYTELLNNIGKEYPNLYQIDNDADRFNKLNHKNAFEIFKPDSNTVYNPLKQFGLYNSLDDICNGDKIQIDYWLKKNFRELLSHFEFTIIKNKHYNSK